MLTFYAEAAHKALQHGIECVRILLNTWLMNRTDRLVELLHIMLVDQARLNLHFTEKLRPF